MPQINRKTLKLREKKQKHIFNLKNKKRKTLKNKPMNGGNTILLYPPNYYQDTMNVHASSRLVPEITGGNKVNKNKKTNKMKKHMKKGGTIFSMANNQFNNVTSTFMDPVKSVNILGANPPQINSAPYVQPISNKY